MPSLGADMEAGTFVEWNVEAGQNVARGQVICVVETQKGAVDVEIWEGGVLAKLIASPGQKIPVGQVMALVATAGEDWKAIAAAAAAPPLGAPRAATPAPGCNRVAKRGARRIGHGSRIVGARQNFAGGPQARRRIGYRSRDAEAVRHPQRRFYGRRRVRGDGEEAAGSADGNARCDRHGDVALEARDTALLPCN